MSMFLRVHTRKTGDQSPRHYGPILSTLIKDRPEEVQQLLIQRYHEACEMPIVSAAEPSESNNVEANVHFAASMCNPPFYDGKEEVFSNSFTISRLYDLL